jgi:hypothetical protein
MITEYKQFHISAFPRTDCWPNGGFSLYEISGDEIAQRVGFVDGRVERRDPWPGYVGTFSTMAQVASAIDERAKGKR